MIRVSVTLLLALLVLLGCTTRPGDHEGEAVVLLHGLGRTERSMMVLGQRLRWAGYEVTVASYPSRDADIATHVEHLAEAVQDCCADEPVVHFVGHSLGGLVIRSYLASPDVEPRGRVVLLAPPSKGSELADWIRDLPIGSEALGPTGRALGTDTTDLPGLRRAPGYEMGIISGNRSLNPIGSIVIPGPDDGMVGVERSRVEGVPVVVLPRSHTFIMNSRFTADAVIDFLRTGAFEL